MNAPESPTALVTDNRRHDLDALRGFAMLLGIVLHAAMSFLPGIKPIWGVEDIYASDAFGLVMHLIHGWRMQLFFFISGFFTMMLWHKQGSMHSLCTELNAFSYPRGRDVHHHPRVDDRSGICKVE